MLSATDPVQKSIDTAHRLLFAPFSFGKWCAMGFTLFLANLLSGGSGGNMRSPKGFGKFSSHRVDTSLGATLETARDWIAGHAVLTAVLVILGLAIFVVCQWLGSRAQFMFLDNVVNDRGRVAEPWGRYRTHGNRVFVFHLLLNLAGLVLMGGGLYLGWTRSRLDLGDLTFGLETLKALLLALSVLVPLGLVMMVISLLLRDFVVPVMYLRGCTVAEGFGVVWNELMPGNGGSFVLFYLMKLILWVAAACLILLGSCLTCCLAGLPYVSSVVFLPVFVFFRAYSLHFMAQAGAEWRMLPESSGH